jgi:hypothetical protein
MNRTHLFGGPDSLRTLRKSVVRKSRRDFTILAGGKTAAAVATTGIGLKRKPTPAGGAQPQLCCSTPPGCGLWRMFPVVIARWLNHRLGLSHSSGMPKTEFTDFRRGLNLLSGCGSASARTHRRSHLSAGIGGDLLWLRFAAQPGQQVVRATRKWASTFKKLQADLSRGNYDQI